TGATGTVSILVNKEEGTNRIYYKYENGTWSEAGNTEQASVSYPWVATNGSMELPLSTDGTNENAISLQKVRDL
ncbi:MAG: hypothetical protein Q4E87_09000, partial [bacterium]|nr:hypothetical protein [bacterium]